MESTIASTLLCTRWSFFKDCPGQGGEPGIFWFPYTYPLKCSALDHSVTVPYSPLVLFSEFELPTMLFSTRCLSVHPPEKFDLFGFLAKTCHAKQKLRRSKNFFLQPGFFFFVWAAYNRKIELQTAPFENELLLFLLEISLSQLLSHFKFLVLFKPYG